MSWTKKASRAPDRRSKGKIEEVVGKILGDKEFELHGKADQLEGDVRNAARTTKDTIKDTVKNPKKI